jgi:hypothetical protein
MSFTWLFLNIKANHVQYGLFFDGGPDLVFGAQTKRTWDTKKNTLPTNEGLPYLGLNKNAIGDNMFRL